MSAEQREELKRLADEYASAMSVYQIHGSAADSVALHITKTNLHAAIDAHTAEPPINAAAQVLGAQANPVTAQDHMPVAAAPNEPVAPLPSAELSVKTWPHLTKGGGPTHAERKAERIAERASPQAVPARRWPEEAPKERE